MIQFESTHGQVLRAEERAGAVYINGAHVVGLERAPGGHGVYIILLGETWPIHVAVEQLQALAPIAERLPHTYLCLDCQRPILYLDGPPPDEPRCVDCATTEALRSAAWEVQRAQQRRQIAAMEQPQLEALYAEAKAQVVGLPYQSTDWWYWRRVQIDASGVLVLRSRRRGENDQLEDLQS